MNRDLLLADAKAWIEATTEWSKMPPDEKFPPELEAVAYMGRHPDCLLLTARFKDREGVLRYDGTATPTAHVFSFIHLTPELSEAAFLKAEALNAQKAETENDAV